MPNKFNARRIKVDGIAFDSLKEAKRYGELKLLEKSGAIHDLKCHPKIEFTVDGRDVLIRSQGYPNGRRASFRPDFYYYDNEKKAPVYEDVKSFATLTEAYRVRRAFFEAIYFPARVEEIL